MPKWVLINYLSLKEGAFPDSDESSRGSNRRAESKFIKMAIAEETNISVIEGFLFCFLNTDNVTFGFQNIVPQRIPLGVRVNASDVVRQNFQAPMYILKRISHSETIIFALKTPVYTNSFP